MKKSRCTYEGCGTEGRYWIGYMADVELKWIPVCGTHDRLIGRHNLVALGWSLKDAIRFESNPETIVHVNGNISNGSPWYGSKSALIVATLNRQYVLPKRAFKRAYERKLKT